MPRVGWTAATAASPGQSWRVVNGARSVQANTRRRTRRPWLSSNASKQGRSGAPSAKALAANHALTSACAFLRFAFQGEQVIAAAAHDPLRDPRLAGERVQA